MRKYTLLIEQLLHGKDLILLGQVHHLRMALILIDNAIEMILFRDLQQDLNRNDMWKRVFNRLKEDIPSEEFEEALKKADIPAIIWEKEQQKLERYFADKVRHVEKKGAINSAISTAIISLHDFRNETYHNDIVKPEILRSLAVLSMENALILLESLNVRPRIYVSTDNFSDFCKRLKLSGSHPWWDEKITEKISSKIRKQLSLNMKGIQKNFISYLENRRIKTQESIDFLLEDDDRFKTTSDLVDFCIEHFANDASVIKNQVNLIHFQGMKKIISTIRNQKERVRCFTKFVEIEKTFNPLEKLIRHVANKKDEQIQLEIDIARGK